MIKLKDILNEAPRIPRKKGQHRGSSSHSDLYTDENPRGTIHGLKFATVKDAKASVGKIKSSGKKHAHKVQAAVAMEQRAKAAGKTAQAAVYRKYIDSVKKSETSLKNMAEKFASKAQQRFMFATDKEAAEKLASKMTKKDYEELPDKVKEGTCGYGKNGKIGEEPAGSHLLKKEFHHGKAPSAKDPSKDAGKRAFKGKGYRVTLKKGKNYTLKGIYQATYKDNPGLSKDKAKSVAARIYKSMKENVVDDHDGKAAPFGSGYKKFDENYKDGKVKGKSRPGRVKRAGASCKGSVTDLRARAKKYGGEKGKMYHWCANMKSGRK